MKGGPSVDVPKLIMQVSRVGASLNRILMIANAEGFLEVSELRRALERNRDLEVCIMDAYEGLAAKHRTAIRPCGAHINS